MAETTYQMKSSAGDRITGIRTPVPRIDWKVNHDEDGVDPLPRPTMSISSEATAKIELPTAACHEFSQAASSKMRIPSGQYGATP